MHLFLLSLLLIITPVAPRKLVADKAASTVTYAMKHPLHAWEAVSHEVNCAATYNDETKHLESVAAAIKLNTFDSKDANRDSHGLEIMEAIKYPTVTFASQRIVTNADGSLTAEGKLTFHGIVRPVTMQATQRSEGGKLTVTGNFDYNLTDFNLERPALLGLKTEDAVKMKFVVVFKL
jgi:polyisoprenoid-binding protein YceI